MKVFIKYAVTMQQFEAMLNEYGEKRLPFLFLTDFELQKPLVFPLDHTFPEDILFDIRGHTNSSYRNSLRPHLDVKPIAFEKYATAFNKVQQEQRYGNSYLTNLTFKTPVYLDISLQDIFFVANAPYRLFYKDEFVVFSPETFVRIDNGIISTYPMKGTIDASIPNAENIILNDEKEKAEHYTIVDLLRNDLGMVAKQIQVKKFRYIDHIKTSSKNLLQVSSEITGMLPANYRKQLGTILTKLLPAGSVSGAPKKKTLEIIKAAEKQNRGYYTGVAGIFNGTSLDSFVMIRFIRKEKEQFYYHSGGGITANSDVKMEYEELNNKIYVPVI